MKVSIATRRAIEYRINELRQQHISEDRDDLKHQDKVGYTFMRRTSSRELNDLKDDLKALSEVA